MKKKYVGFSVFIVVLSVLFIIFLATGLGESFFNTQEEFVRTRVITPRDANAFHAGGLSDHLTWAENLNPRIPLNDDEIVIAVLNRDSEDGEEQFVVFRQANADNQVYITFLSYDAAHRGYRRMWNAPIAATRSETITVFSQDLIGDRNNCIIVTGMNDNNEHTMTIFRRNLGLPVEQPFRKIAEIQVDGFIIIQETMRSLAYQHGITRGQSFNIAAYGHDYLSSNILDQIETIFSFNPVSEQYEQIRVSRIPGSQIEQRRLREILSGEAGGFEEFINDLWFYVTPQGTIDTSRYMYFDPVRREIIFFGDGSQQVFRWQTSTPTRIGLHIRSQNISISTLSRFVNIELESLDRINLRVIEDVRLRITLNTSVWDGSYRRAGAAVFNEQVSQIRPGIEAVFDSSWGRVHLLDNGEYTISSGTAFSEPAALQRTRRGRYVFFRVNSYDLIEFRPEDGDESRLVFKVENVAGVMILSRVRVGTMGIQDLLEPPVTFTPVDI